MLPLVNIAAAAEAKPAASPQAAMESAAQKQREATLAAMQSSVDKQGASIAVGKDARKATPVTSFFQLPPPAPLPGAASVSPPAPEPVMPDINCEPLPVADVAPVLEQAARRLEQLTREQQQLLRAELKRDQIHAFGADPWITRCQGSMSATIEPAE